VLKITDGVLRHLAVRRPKPGPAPTAQPPSADREPEYAAEPAFSESGARLQPGSGEPEEE
jgi:hypothetical protein